MEWLSVNWFWVLIGLAFVGMHFFGHGGHGSHGDRGGKKIAEASAQGVERPPKGRQD